VLAARRGHAGVKTMRELVYPCWMLGCVGLAIGQREIVWCSVGGLVGLGVRMAAARGWKTEAGGLALANLLTFFRTVLSASLPRLFPMLPRFGFVGLVLLILILDGVDGWVARKRGEISRFGAALDMETDALTVMVLGILLWERGIVGAWVLAAGLWRYAYSTVVSLVPSLGDAPPSRLYRWTYCFLMICFAGAFLPWPAIANVLAATGTTLVSISFVHSLARSSAFAKRVTVNQ
jgi:phosphatidylglycerophosphate synthase